jgi:hypothetical protein
MTEMAVLCCAFADEVMFDSAVVVGKQRAGIREVAFSDIRDDSVGASRKQRKERQLNETIKAAAQRGI